MFSKDHPLEGFRFHLEFRPRLSDLDPQGQVHNARFFTYFEEARAAYLQRLGLLAAKPQPLALLIQRNTCRYHAPVQHHHLVQVFLRTADWGRRGFCFHYALWLPEEDCLAAMGSTRVACLNPATGRGCALPAEFCRVMQRFEAGELG
ncbi:MAG: acyl-CoA thioesterase [Desulfarculus sp.]|jgi:acyl-CoA thioester hydrolase|nr:MAG: acyl-CoA thioesterase [Desulfarculus sp.]